jgi:ribosomal protein S12 methylthiotransferase accessory factor
MDNERLLALRPGLTVFPSDTTDADGLWLLLNSRIVHLRGRGGRRLLKALDTPRTLDDLCDRLRPSNRGEVVAAVEALDRHGLLDTLGGGDVPPFVRALSDRGADAAAVMSVMKTARVRVIGEGLLAEAAQDALQQYLDQRVEPVKPAEIDDFAAPHAADATEATMVALDTEQPRLLDEINAWALRTRSPWLLLSAAGFVARVGPLFLPRETACYACYRTRLDANLSAYDDYMRVMGPIRDGRVQRAPADDLDPGIAAIAAGNAALEIVLLLIARVSALRPSLPGAFADYSLLTHTTSIHRVLKLPRCPACGASASGHPTIRAWMEP